MSVKETEQVFCNVVQFSGGYLLPAAHCLETVFPSTQLLFRLEHDLLVDLDFVAIPGGLRSGCIGVEGGYMLKALG